jgi:hypothetical protein
MKASPFKIWQQSSDKQLFIKPVQVQTQLQPYLDEPFSGKKAKNKDDA